MRSGGWIENRKKEQGTSTYRLIAKSVGRVRKANVSGTKNGSEEAVSALIQELIERTDSNHNRSTRQNKLHILEWYSR